MRNGFLSRPWLPAVALPLALLTMLVTVTPAAAETVLRRGNGGEPTTLDPHRTDGRIESNILRDLFEGLVTPGPDGSIQPGVAESWETSPDGLVYTFHLYSNAKWSNGVPLTSADLLYSFRRAIAPQPGADYAANLTVIKNADAVIAGKAPPTDLGIEAPDPLTLRITLRSPTPYFLAVLSADNRALPVYRPTADKDGADAFRLGTLIANGAYRLSDWKPGEQLTLERNPFYHHVGDLKIDKVVYYPIDNGYEELKRFRAGQLDTTYEVPQEQVRWISFKDPREFWNKPFIGTYYFALNLTTEPFRGNLKLRQALSMAINRDALVEKVTRAGEMPAYGLVPPILSGYRYQTLSFAELPMEQRLEQARRLFVEAGYGPARPLPLELLYNTSENNRLIADAIAAMWDEAFGKALVLTKVSTDRTDYLKRRGQYRFQVVRAAWFGEYPDPTAFLNLLLSIASPPRNDSGYKNPRYDALLAQAADTADQSTRFSLLQQAEKMMLEDVAIIPIYHFATKSLVSERVKGWLFNVRDVHLSRFLSLSN